MRITKTMTVVVARAIVIGTLGVATACSSSTAAPVAPTSTRSNTEAGPMPVDLVVDRAAFPVALLGEPDGGFLYAERLTGAVRRVDAQGHLQAEPVTSVAVRGSADDQRGLLGLTRTPDGRLFAAWTRADDGRIVVGELYPSSSSSSSSSAAAPRLAWVGPVSASLANGGHLDATPGGQLVIGIGDLLEDRALDLDPRVPNRKLLSLDADGPPTQSPHVVSVGWNNPFGFTVTPSGEIWAGDNTGADGPERIGRGDEPARLATPLGGPGADEIVPSAVVALGPDRLGLCSYRGGDLREISIATGRAVPTGRRLATPCQTGAATLADGRVALATPDQVFITKVAP